MGNAPSDVVLLDSRGDLSKPKPSQAKAIPSEAKSRLWAKTGYSILPAFLLAGVRPFENAYKELFRLMNGPYFSPSTEWVCLHS